MLFVLFVHCHACPSRQPAGRMLEGTLPSTKPTVTGAVRSEGFGGDRAVFPFSLPAGTRNSPVNPSAQLEQDKGNNAARGIAARPKGKRKHIFLEGQ